MRTKFWKAAVAATALAGFATGAMADGHAKPGGTLDFVVGSKIPSYDAHQETTFGMIHPIVVEPGGDHYVELDVPAPARTRIRVVRTPGGAGVEAARIEAFAITVKRELLFFRQTRAAICKALFHVFQTTN